MDKLSLPTYPFKLKSENGTEHIFGLIRKKWLVLTPEEWVRQHWLAYLIHQLGYPWPGDCQWRKVYNSAR